MSRDLFPGASNGEYGAPPELLPVIERGNGARVWDPAGQPWSDYTRAWGSALVGHAHPAVTEAAARQAPHGINFAAVNRRAVELADRLHELAPFLERIRFVASGTEATLMCLRVAAAATGRPKVLKFAGAYHGQHPVGVAAMLRGTGPDGTSADPSGAGADWVSSRVLAAPFNDLASTEALIRSHARELAAVIVEPVHRCLAPVPGFLEGLRALTRELGIVLIFDEVVTGFRLAPGGAAEYFGVRPDLAAYGKALGGGFPIGAYGGSAALMEVVNEARLEDPSYLWSASTTGGNPVSCAAALAAIRVLCAPGVHDHLHALGRKFREILASVLRDTRETAQVLGLGPLAQIAFAAEPIRDHAGWQRADRRRSRAVMLELLESKVFLNPMGTKLYLSLAHDDGLLAEFAERLALALRATRPTG
ncbi:MAG: aminotransferase class III-fold pyridoxal phosphate-dependent enzyme [Verrucomicrobiales bacterium]|nr:aminotransferase class III-fold pyridoxal phosphate-dependent enzyme [Verrucomicrobiales bacterium]